MEAENIALPLMEASHGSALHGSASWHTRRTLLATLLLLAAAGAGALAISMVNMNSQVVSLQAQLSALRDNLVSANDARNHHRPAKRRVAINPVKWGEQYLMSQAELIEDSQGRRLHCSGQVSFILHALRNKLHSLRNTKGVYAIHAWIKGFPPSKRTRNSTTFVIVASCSFGLLLQVAISDDGSSTVAPHDMCGQVR